MPQFTIYFVVSSSFPRLQPRNVALSLPSSSEKTCEPSEPFESPAIFQMKIIASNLFGGNAKTQHNTIDKSSV